MKHDETLAFIYKDRTVVVMDESGKVVAAGSPKAVADTLKQRMVDTIVRASHDPEPQGGGL